MALKGFNQLPEIAIASSRQRPLARQILMILMSDLPSNVHEHGPAASLWWVKRLASRKRQAIINRRAKAGFFWQGSWKQFVIATSLLVISMIYEFYIVLQDFFKGFMLCSPEAQQQQLAAKIKDYDRPPTPPPPPFFSPPTKTTTANHSRNHNANHNCSCISRNHNLQPEGKWTWQQRRPTFRPCGSNSRWRWKPGYSGGWRLSRVGGWWRMASWVKLVAL